MASQKCFISHYKLDKNYLEAICFPPINIYRHFFDLHSFSYSLLQLESFLFCFFSAPYTPQMELKFSKLVMFLTQSNFPFASPLRVTGCCIHFYLFLACDDGSTLFKRRRGRKAWPILRRGYTKIRRERPWGNFFPNLSLRYPFFQCEVIWRVYQQNTQM